MLLVVINITVSLEDSADSCHSASPSDSIARLRPPSSSIVKYASPNIFTDQIVYSLTMIKSSSTLKTTPEKGPYVEYTPSLSPIMHRRLQEPRHLREQFPLPRACQVDRRRSPPEQLPTIKIKTEALDSLDLFLREMNRLSSLVDGTRNTRF